MSGEKTPVQRVWVALAGRHDRRWRAIIDAWRECVERWGPESGPAKGGLLALVREALGLEVFAVRVVRAPDIARGYLGFDGWEVWDRQADDGPFSSGTTEVEALVSALEVAP